MSKDESLEESFRNIYQTKSIWNSLKFMILTRNYEIGFNWRYYWNDLNKIPNHFLKLFLYFNFFKDCIFKIDCFFTKMSNCLSVRLLISTNNRTNSGFLLIYKESILPAVSILPHNAITHLFWNILKLFIILICSYYLYFEVIRMFIGRFKFEKKNQIPRERFLYCRARQNKNFKHILGQQKWSQT